MLMYVFVFVFVGELCVSSVRVCLKCALVSNVLTALKHNNIFGYRKQRLT